MSKHPSERPNKGGADGIACEIEVRRLTDFGREMDRLAATLKRAN